MSDITPKIESQMVRIMEALDRALIHAAQAGTSQKGCCQSCGAPWRR